MKYMTFLREGFPPSKKKAPAKAPAKAAGAAEGVDPMGNSDALVDMQVAKQKAEEDKLAAQQAAAEKQQAKEKAEQRKTARMRAAAEKEVAADLTGLYNDQSDEVVMHPDIQTFGQYVQNDTEEDDDEDEDAEDDGDDSGDADGDSKTSQKSTKGTSKKSKSSKKKVKKKSIKESTEYPYVLWTRRTPRYTVIAKRLGRKIGSPVEVRVLSGQQLIQLTVTDDNGAEQIYLEYM